MNFICNCLGKILKDEETLESHHIQTGDSLHLVVKKKVAEAPKPEESQAKASTGAASSTGSAGPSDAGMPWMGTGMPNMGAAMGGLNNEFMQAQMETVKMFNNPIDSLESRTISVNHKQSYVCSNCSSKS